MAISRGTKRAGLLTADALQILNLKDYCVDGCYMVNLNLDKVASSPNFSAILYGHASQTFQITTLLNLFYIKKNRNRLVQDLSSFNKYVI